MKHSWSDEESELIQIYDDINEHLYKWHDWKFCGKKEFKKTASAITIHAKTMSNYELLKLIS